MFCPICRAQYRPGFTRCSDCDVALVPSVPQPEDMPSGRLEPLWEGDELAVHASLLEELDKSGIRYFDRALSNYPGVRRADYFPIQPMARFGYQVSVLSSDLKTAREILQKLLEQKPEDISLPAEEVESSNIAVPANSRDAETASAGSLSGAGEDATCEVWAATDETLAAFLETALRENGIPIRVEGDVLQKRILVRLADEAPAREILREITEASPPQ